MALLIQEALKRVQNNMMGAMLKSIATTDEMSALISIDAVDGTSVKLDREGLLPDTTFIDDTGVTSEESTGEDDVPEIQFRRIVGNMDMDNMAVGVAGSSAAEKRNRQIAKKGKATWRLVKDKLINGGHTTGHTIISAAEIATAIDAMTYSPGLDSNRRGPGSIKYTHAGTLWQFRAPGDIAYGEAVAVAADSTVTLRSHNPSFYIVVTIDVSDLTVDGEGLITFQSSSNEFDGILRLAHPSMITAAVAADGDDFEIGLLDDLHDKVKVRENLAYVMPGKLINQYLLANRLLGGATPQNMTLPGYATQVPTYRGIPLLTDDNFSTYQLTSPDVSDIALVSLNADEGLVLAAQSSGGEVGSLTVDADPRSQSVFGFRVENVGTLEGKDATRTRVKWYGAPVLKSHLALAIKRGVRHVNA